MDGEPLLRVLLRATGRLLVTLRYNNPFDMGGGWGRRERFTPFMDDRYLQRHTDADLEQLGGVVWFAVAAGLAMLAAGAASGPFERLLHGGR